MESILNRLKANIVDNNFYLLDDNLDIITSNLYQHNIPFEISDSVFQLNKTHGISELAFQKDTTFFKDDHIWSVRKLELKNLSIASSFGSEKSLELITPSNWAVVQELPPMFLNKSLSLLYSSVFIFNILSVILLMILSYFFIRWRVQKENHFKEIEAKNLLLSKKRNLLEKNNNKISEINNRLEIRNKQLSEFNYLVSHNLKAPVTSMSVIVSMIKKENEPKTINELLPKLSQVAESITELTKDIGEYVSILDEKKIKLEEVNIETVIVHIKRIFSENSFKFRRFLM